MALILTRLVLKEVYLLVGNVMSLLGLKVILLFILTLRCRMRSVKRFSVLPGFMEALRKGIKVSLENYFEGWAMTLSFLDTYSCDHEGQISRPKIFCFEARWCLKRNFEEVVLSNWNSFNGSIPDKLRFMGQQFQHWSRLKNREKSFSRSNMKKRLQELYGIDTFDEVLAEIMEAQLDLNLEIDKEEIFWEQRAWANWLKHGDRNTSFFHKAVVQQFYRNRISGLEREDKSRVSTKEEML
ncbi:hypothetical protein CXB51_033513 [Gossypium anomalum]|uniref:Uncharacterized protein n=1 Tax=Gossypium anomalum TaxID=47600 RepID=A0A8J5Y9M6_9ROSI|nr:hypothetical protein CXB51_033513 [Gossypium anomalum]